MFPAEDLEDLRPAERPSHSCYLLEFSVMPGGARQSHVTVLTTLDELADEIFDGYLVMWYGALVQLWVVQEGTVVQGVDLHPYLRSGDERSDRALARLIAYREARHDRWEAIDTVLESFFGHDHMAAALPLVARVLELQDRIETDDTEAVAELARILTAAEEERSDTAYGGVEIEYLTVDHEALAAVVPPLREPVLRADWVSVRWAGSDLRHPATHLHTYCDPAEDTALRRGFNDLENGDDDPYGVGYSGELAAGG